MQASHIWVLGLRILFLFSRQTDASTSLNADSSKASSLKVQTPERSLNPQTSKGIL